VHPGETDLVEDADVKPPFGGNFRDGDRRIGGGCAGIEISGTDALGANMEFKGGFAGAANPLEW
jgi:hypothetical protein